MHTNNHTVLITGGGSGIGLALARTFAEAGNRVIIAGRDHAKLAAAQASIPGLETAVLDLADRMALASLAAAYPEVSVLVNNAGVQYNYAFGDGQVPAERIEHELQTNLAGPLMLCKLFLPHLAAKPAAAIVNVSSGLGIVPKQSAPVYCASKAGMHIFSKALRWQLEGTPVKVFEIIPPLVDTAMTAGRGRGKITPEALAAEFWAAFRRDTYEVRVGKTWLLFVLQRLAPRVAERIMRPGL